MASQYEESDGQTHIEQTIDYEYSLNECKSYYLSHVPSFKST